MRHDGAEINENREILVMAYGLALDACELSLCAGIDPVRGMTYARLTMRDHDMQERSRREAFWEVVCAVQPAGP